MNTLEYTRNPGHSPTRNIITIIFYSIISRNISEITRKEPVASKEIRDMKLLAAILFDCSLLVCCHSDVLVHALLQSQCVCVRAVPRHWQHKYRQYAWRSPRIARDPVRCGLRRAFSVFHSLVSYSQSNTVPRPEK